MTCEKCQSMQVAGDIHSFDAALHVRVKDAERAVIEAAKARRVSLEHYCMLRRAGGGPRDPSVVAADHAVLKRSDELDQAVAALAEVAL